MKSKRNIKWALIALTLVFSIALMAACSSSDDAMKSDKVTETQFDEYIDASLSYFDDFSKPLQLVAEMKASGISAKQEYSRANGIEMQKETYFGMSAVSYRKHEDGMIKEYSKYPNDEWTFDMYGEYDDELILVEEFGFDYLLEPIKGHFDWFEYKDDVYNLKTAYFTDLLEATDGDDVTLKDFKLAFKNGMLSGISTKYVEEAVSVTGTYTFTYNNTSITIPKAALDAEIDMPIINNGKLKSADFSSALTGTVDYIKDLNAPLSFSAEVEFSDETMNIYAKRIGDGKEWFDFQNDYEFYTWRDGDSIIGATKDYGDDEWSTSTISYQEFGAHGGQVSYFLTNQIPFTAYLETFSDSDYYNWFTYESWDKSHSIKSNYLSEAYDLLLSQGLELVPEDGELMEFKFYFEGGKVIGLYINVWYNDSEYGFTYADMSFSLEYDNIQITIPDDALSAAQDSALRTAQIV